MVAPIISVVIPAYNGAAVIVDAIESLLDQTFKDILVIMVDDCSTDNTVALVRNKFSDSRLVVIEHKNNLGAAAARNTGISIAINLGSEFIAFLDADDIARSLRFEKQLAYLNDHPDVGGVGSAAELFGDKSGCLDFLCDPDDVAASTLFTCEFLMPTLTFRASALMSLANVWFKPEYGANCVWEMFSRLIQSGVRIANLPDYLVAYRRWNQQMTYRIEDTETCLATRLRSDMLAWMGIDLSAQKLSAHLMVAPCYWNLTRTPHDGFTCNEGEDWLSFLSEYNHAIPDEKRKFNRESMDKILKLCQKQLKISCADIRVRST